MANNVVANPGTGGATFTTDQWAGDPSGASQIPANKLIFGARGSGYTFVDDATGARWPVKIGDGPSGTLTDRHGTITTGGTSQQIAAVNSNRKYLLIFNPPTATETLFINFTTAAAQDATSIPITPGGSFLMQAPSFVSTEAVNAVAATTGHAFGCKEA